MRRATVRASSADVSCQPCVATMPSRASIPTTIRSAPNRATACATISGCRTATVPSTTRVAPNARARATSSSVRMPPPNWIGRLDRGANLGQTVEVEAEV